MDLTLFLLSLGATARLTRLINTDVLMAWAREAVMRRWGVDSKPATLVTCPWCASPYIAAAVLAAGWLSGAAAWWTFLATVLTVSHLVALAATWLDDE